jgi:hypothetical protein
MLRLNIYQRSHPLEPAKWPSRSIPPLQMKTLRSRKDILVLQTYPQPPEDPPFRGLVRQGRNVLLFLGRSARLHRDPGAAGEDNRFRPDRIDRAAHHTLATYKDWIELTDGIALLPHNVMGRRRSGSDPAV